MISRTGDIFREQEYSGEGEIMIHIEKVDHKNVWDIIKLAPFESQYNFVASNDDSLMEAYIAVMSEDAYAYPFGIYDGDSLIT